MVKRFCHFLLMFIFIIGGITFLPATSYGQCTLGQIQSVAMDQDGFLCNGDRLSLSKFKEMIQSIKEENSQELIQFQHFCQLLGIKVNSSNNNLTKHKFRNIKKTILKRISENYSNNNNSSGSSNMDTFFVKNLNQGLIENDVVSLIKKMDKINSDKERDTCEISHKGNSIFIDFESALKMYPTRKNKKNIDANNVFVINDKKGEKHLIKDMNLSDLMEIIQVKSRYIQDSDSLLLLEHLMKRYEIMKKSKKSDPCLEGVVKTAILFERRLMDQYAEKCASARAQKMKIDNKFLSSFIEEHKNEPLKFDREYAIRRAIYMRKLFDSYQKNRYLGNNINEKNEENYIPFYQYLSLFYDLKRQANGLNLWVDEGMKEATKNLSSMKLPNNTLDLFDKNASEDDSDRFRHWSKIFYEAELLAKKQIFPSTRGTIPVSSASLQGKEMQKELDEIATRNDLFFEIQRDKYSNKGLLENEVLSKWFDVLSSPPNQNVNSIVSKLSVLAPTAIPTPVLSSSSIVRFDLSSAGVKAILDQVNQASDPFITILNETNVTNNLNLFASVPITKSETACLQAYEESRKIIGEAYPSIKDDLGALNTVVMLVNFQDCPRIPKSLLGVDLKGYSEPVLNTFFSFVSPMANIFTSAYSCLRSDFLNQIRDEACRDNFINKIMDFTGRVCAEGQKLGNTICRKIGDSSLSAGIGKYMDNDYSLQIVHPEDDPNYCSYSLFEAPGQPDSESYPLFKFNPKKAFDSTVEFGGEICSNGFNQARTMCNNMINPSCVAKMGIHLLKGFSRSTFDPIASSVLLEVKSNDIVNNNLKIDKMNISKVDNNTLKVIIDLKEMSVNAKLGLNWIENHESKKIGEYPVKLEINNNPQISVDVDITNISAPKIANLKIIPKKESQKLTFLGSPDDKSVMAGLLRSVTNLNEGLINNVVNDSVDLAIQYAVGPKISEYLNDQIATFSKNIFDNKNTKLELRDLMEMTNIANFPSLLQQMTGLIAMENFIQNADFNNVSNEKKKLLKIIAIKKTLREKIVKKLSRGTPFDPDPTSIHEVENDLNNIIKLFSEEDLNKLKSGNRNIVYKTALYTLTNLLESSRSGLEKKLANNDNSIPVPYKTMLKQTSDKMLSQINLYKGLLSSEIDERSRDADKRDDQSHLIVNSKTEDIEVEFKRMSENPVPKIEVYGPDGKLNNCYHSVFAISPNFINTSINVMAKKFPKIFSHKGLLPMLEVDDGKTYLQIMGQRIHLDKCLQTGSNCFDNILLKTAKYVSGEVLSSIYFVINYIREIISAKLHNFWQAHGFDEHLITRTVRNENLSNTIRDISPKLVGTHFSNNGLYFFVNFLNSHPAEGETAQACSLENSSFVEK